jgi:hypothetical protein
MLVGEEHQQGPYHVLGSRLGIQEGRITRGVLVVAELVSRRFPDEYYV